MGDTVGRHKHAVLREFYTVVTRKTAIPITVGAARQLVEDFLAWECVVNDADAIVAAFDTRVGTASRFGMLLLSTPPTRRVRMSF